MASRRTAIQVPPLQEGEQPATPEQLQFIRQLVAGMSLQGFRFDYRKLGTTQAGSVIDQLMRIQESQGPVKQAASSGGCVASFVRGTTTLIVSLIVLAGVVGGGYLIYDHYQNQPKPVADNDDGKANEYNPDLYQPNKPGSNPRNPNNNTPGEFEDSFIFGGLGATDDTGKPTPDNDPSDTGSTTPGTTANTPDPAAINDRLAQRQARKLEKMLVELSQFTRNDFNEATRTQSVAAMQRHLDAMPEAMAKIDSANPTLATRIRAVVQEFGLTRFDGDAMRDEIKAIREDLDKLFNAE